MFDENWEWGKERWKDLCAEDTGDHCSGQSSTLWPINQKNTLGQVFYWNWDWDYLIWQNWPKKQSILWQEKQFCDSKKDKFVTKRNKQFCEEEKNIWWMIKIIKMMEVLSRCWRRRAIRKSVWSLSEFEAWRIEPFP